MMINMIEYNILLILKKHKYTHIKLRYWENEFYSLFLKFLHGVFVAFSPTFISYFFPSSVEVKDTEEIAAILFSKSYVSFYLIKWSEPLKTYCTHNVLSMTISHAGGLKGHCINCAVCFSMENCDCGNLWF